MKMRPLQAVVVRLSWKSLPGAIPLGLLALIFIPTALLLVHVFEELGWLEFIDANEEEW